MFVLEEADEVEKMFESRDPGLTDGMQMVKL